jgi:hypothetical protein
MNSGLYDIIMHSPQPSICTSFHRRYRICSYHAGLPEMMVDGKAVRFCQQCGRFQPLSDFEGRKKSCRNKLQMHNAQRKRVREKNQAGKIKRYPAPPKSPIFSPSPSQSAMPQLQNQKPTEQNVYTSNGVEDAFVGVCTPVKREALPVFLKELITDDFELAPLSVEEVDMLMESFNDPLASQVSLSILESLEEEEEERQQQQRQQQPQQSSLGLLDPIVMGARISPELVLNFGYANTTAPCFNHLSLISF